MTRPRSIRMWMAAALAALALPATSNLASAASYPPGFPPLRVIVCGVAGCLGDDKACANISLEISNLSGLGKASVTFFCYLGARPASSGGEWEI